MGDRSDPHRILFKLFLDHYHHHCQCSANEGKPYMFVFISQKDVQLSTWACVTKITVWLSVVSISSLGGYSKYNWTGTCCKVIASLRSSSLVFHYILASLIYLRFYLCIYPYSEVIFSSMYEASDSRSLDKPFVVLVLKALFQSALAQEEWVLINKAVSSESPLGEGWGMKVLIHKAYFHFYKQGCCHCHKWNKHFCICFVFLFMGVIC